MTLSQLVAELSEYMAAHPGDDPVVEMRVDINHPLHDEFRNEIGEVSVQAMRPVDHTKYVMHADKMIGVWLCVEDDDLD